MRRTAAPPPPLSPGGQFRGFDPTRDVHGPINSGDGRGRHSWRLISSYLLHSSRCRPTSQSFPSFSSPHGRRLTPDVGLSSSKFRPAFRTPAGLSRRGNTAASQARPAVRQWRRAAENKIDLLLFLSSIVISRLLCWGRSSPSPGTAEIRNLALQCVGLCTARRPHCTIRAIRKNLLE